MRLSRLKLTNFRQHADTLLEFDSGLTGIIGPNGAGKSTILEAIAWVLYGGTILRGTNDSIRFQRAPARAPVRVELDFELGGHRYRVVRGLSMAELYLDGGEEPIANSVTAVAEIIQRRIGMTRSEFFNTYFTGQKDLAVMHALSASERAQFLSRVLGYEKLRVAQDLCAARRKELGSEIQGLRTGMPEREHVLRETAEAAARLREATKAQEDAERAEAETGAALADVAPRWLAAQTGREERERIERELAVLASEEAGLVRAAEKLEQELAQVAEARTQLAPMLPDIEALERVDAELEAQRALASSDGSRRALEKSRTNLSNDCATMTQEVERLEISAAQVATLTPELEQRRKALEDAQGKLELRRTEWVRERESVEGRLRTLRETYADLRDQRDVLLNAGEAGNCPTCTRPLGEHFRAVLETLERQMETVEADGSYFRTRREQLQAMPADIEHLDGLRKTLQADVSGFERRLTEAQGDAKRLVAERADLDAKRTRLAAVAAELAALPSGYDKTEHDRLEAERERLVERTTAANRLALRVEREPALLRERESLERQREELVAKREAALQRRARLAVPDGDFGELQRLHEGVAAAHAEAGQRAAGARAARSVAAAADARAIAAKLAYDALAAKVEALEGDRRLHDELHRAYSELRNELNYQLRPEISEIASELLKTITDARYTELELDDKYRIQVLEDGVPKPVISGGEEDVANLVLRLAISQMIADRAGQAFSLLVLDEVFGSLDDVRRQNVVALLRGLEDRFDQVIVITHIEGVRDGLDRVIQVDVDEASGAAKVTQPDAAVALLADAAAA
jgi:DNA repair protein SbcC/Rad50